MIRQLRRKIREVSVKALVILIATTMVFLLLPSMRVEASLPTSDNLTTMDYYLKAQPYVDVPAADSVQTQSMDYYFQGQPFVVNYSTAPSVADISNTDNLFDFGLVGADSSYATGTDNFTVTNNSGFAVNITIGGTDMTSVPPGGTTWTLSDNATVGVNTIGFTAGLDGGSCNVTVKKTAPYNTLITSLADNGTQKWGLTFWTPTAPLTDNTTKSGTITLTATAS